MSDEQAHDVLQRLFDAVIDEARRNPAFARKLIASLPQQAVVRIERPVKPRATAEIAQFHAINLFESHGEAMLRGRLAALRTKAELMAIAKQSGLVLTGRGRLKNASRDEIAEDIVEAAREYLKGRSRAG